MKFDDFFKKKNAHFWADFPGNILVKITLKPGESIYRGSENWTDEGILHEYYSYTHTGKNIIRDYASHFRGCDGITDTENSDVCSLDNLKAIRSCLSVHEGMSFPNWESEESC